VSRRALAVACLVWLPAACAPAPEPAGPRPSVPLADAVAAVEQDVAALPGVEDVHLTFHDNRTDGRAIDGSVEVDGAVDPVEVLDDVHAVLWTFAAFEPATIRVAATADGDVAATAKDLGSRFEVFAQLPLRERYGPWPGPGPTG
jgi:hypothetical protein